MSAQIAFLLGAGASHGAVSADYPRPPVMKDLYDELAKYSPPEWGEGSSNASHADEYREDFEKTFNKVVLRIGVGDGLPDFTPDPLTLLEGQRTLARYFSSLTLPPGGLDLYSKLLSRLTDSDLIKHSLFGTLNYDCLLELAADALGLCVDYTCDRINQRVVRLVKLHGSCNWITERLSEQKRALLTSAVTGGEVIFLPVQGLENSLKEKVSGWSPLHLPVMSQISPGKQNYYGMVWIGGNRHKWAESVLVARVVVIIGVSHNANDTHVIGVIKNTGAQKIFYIGGEDNFERWRNENKQFFHVAGTFDKGFEDLLCRLQS